MPLGSVSDLRSRLRPKTKIGISCSAVKCVFDIFDPLKFWDDYQKKKCWFKIDMKNRFQVRHSVRCMSIRLRRLLMS
jgi:hypothetical protein